MNCTMYTDYSFLVELELETAASMWIVLNQKDRTGDDSAEGAHGRPPDLVLLL